MQIKKTTFGEINVGEKFTITNPNSEYWNIKVRPSLIVGENHGIAFNVIALIDGRPRTFSDNEEVSVQIK